ncbi:MAG: gliding motility protein GldL [Prevotella sp.]|nr:gliding motility protein GldL [Prevotella sp.]
MTEYSKYNVIYRLQRWLDSVPGQTFLNYAYSWGASIVILGTLFKLTHLPGANIMLYIGMGTEVIVFFISAFDRPFDKTAIGKDLPTHVGDDVELSSEEVTEGGNAEESVVAGASGGAVVGGGIIGGVIGVGQGTEEGEGGVAGGGVAGAGVAGGGVVVVGGGGSVTGQSGESVVEGGEQSEGQVGQPVAGGGVVNPTEWILNQQQVSPEMEEATNNYVEELKKLTEMLSKVSEQSERLTRDSEEMENLNRTLTGICKVYEMQLKGASAQIGTIDQINEQSRKMAAQIEQLNKIYARMIEAMTVNMRMPNSGNNMNNKNNEINAEL